MRISGTFLTPQPDGTVTGVLPTFLKHVTDVARCVIIYDIASQARAERLFEAGETDLFFGARNETRDRLGPFFLLYTTHVSLISRASLHPGIHTVDQLRQAHLIVDIVRGFDYGRAYRTLVADLDTAHRVREAATIDEIAQRMAEGNSDATLMGTGIFIDAARTAGIVNDVEAEALEGLPDIPSGLYLNQRALPPADLALLSQALDSQEIAFTDLLRPNLVDIPWARGTLVERPGGRIAD